MPFGFHIQLLPPILREASRQAAEEPKEIKPFLLRGLPIRFL